MIKYSEEFYKRTFTAKNMKEAYMKAVKWYSTNVLSKAEFKNVHVQYIKDDKSPTITIHLFAVQDGEEEIMKEHCKCCEEMHHSFFINEDTHCSRCSAAGFQNRLGKRINIKKDYYKEMLRKRLGE